MTPQSPSLQVWLQLEQTQILGSEQRKGAGRSGVAHEGFTPCQRGFLSSSFNQPNLTEAVKPHVSYCSMIFADCSVTTTVPDEWKKREMLEK